MFELIWGPSSLHYYWILLFIIQIRTINQIIYPILSIHHIQALISWFVLLCCIGFLCIVSTCHHLWDQLSFTTISASNASLASQIRKHSNKVSRCKLQPIGLLFLAPFWLFLHNESNLLRHKYQWTILIIFPTFSPLPSFLKPQNFRETVLTLRT